MKQEIENKKTLGYLARMFSGLAKRTIKIRFPLTSPSTISRVIDKAHHIQDYQHLIYEQSGSAIELGNECVAWLDNHPNTDLKILQSQVLRVLGIMQLVEALQKELLAAQEIQLITEFMPKKSDRGNPFRLLIHDWRKVDFSIAVGIESAEHMKMTIIDLAEGIKQFIANPTHKIYRSAESIIANLENVNPSAPEMKKPLQINNLEPG